LQCDTLHVDFDSNSNSNSNSSSNSNSGNDAGFDEPALMPIKPTASLVRLVKCLGEQGKDLFQQEQSRLLREEQAQSNSQHNHNHSRSGRQHNQSQTQTQNQNHTDKVIQDQIRRMGLDEPDVERDAGM
jgi:hypothetical protein